MRSVSKFVYRGGLLGFGILILWQSLRLQDHLLFWTSLTFLCALGWLSLTVYLSGLILKTVVRRAAHPNRIDVASEDEHLTGWTFELPPWVFLSGFSCELNGRPSVFVRRGGRFSERVVFERRRLHKAVRRRFTVRDRFGWASYRFWDIRPVPLRVLPEVRSAHAGAPPIGVVTGADLPSPYSAETGERLDMRRYRRGDPLRLVLWTIYQRSGHVMVRAPEKAVSQHQRTGLYLLTSASDAPAAKLARVLIERDALGVGWRFGADGNSPWAEQRETALNLLAESGRLAPETRLNQYLFELARDRFGKCLILVTADPATRNQKLSLFAHGGGLPHIGIEIWVVYDQPNVPSRKSFPTVAGAEIRLVERRNSEFVMKSW